MIYETGHIYELWIAEAEAMILAVMNAIFAIA